MRKGRSQGLGPTAIILAPDSAALDERENLVTPYLLVIAVLRRRREREARRKRTFWIREIFKKREEFIHFFGPLP